MNSFAKSLQTAMLMAILAVFAIGGKTQAQANFDAVGRAMTIMLEDSHFDPLPSGEQLNKRILNLYLNTLDPEKLYFTQADVLEFTQRYTGNNANGFDILLLRSRGMEPALEIYNRFATRVAKRTDYIERIAENAAFNFNVELMVPLDRKKAPWPADMFDAHRIWSLRIQHEILTEELLHEELRAPKPKEPAPPILQPAPPEVEEENQEEPRDLPKVEPDTKPLEITSNQKTGELSPKEPIKVEAPSEENLWKRDPPRKVVKTRYQRFEETVLAAAPEEIADYFFSAVAQAQDPHSDYLSVKENERFDRELKNQLSGIGAELASQPDGSTRILGIIVNGPAHRQGELQPNDRIVAIDSLNNGAITDITYLPIERVVQLILGRKDSSVGLIIENQKPEDSERRKVVIRRGMIDLKNAAASAEIVKIAQPEGPPKSLGWITIPSFYLDFEDGDPSVYKDVKRLVNRLKSENVDAIALDLRDNGGGSLTEVPKLAGLFLSRGPVMQSVNQKKETKVTSSTPIKPDFEGPLVVVTNRNSASSSEILVGALQDYNRAIVVGEASTFGKGTVQEKMGIANFLRFMQNPARAGDLKTTVQKFYRVTGSSTQLQGVVPHIILPSSNDTLEIGERYLKHALAHDNIRPASGFKPSSFRNLFLPVVAEQSRQRVLESPDFRYIREDIVKHLGERRKNLITLNRKRRLDDLAAEKKETIARNSERRSRFERMEWQDSQRFHFLRLSLDDLNREKLLTVDRKRDSNAVILRAPISDRDLASMPQWPSGIDPVKREALTILEDLTEAIKDDAELNALKRAVQEATNF